MDDIVSDEKSPLRPVEVPAGGGSDNGDDTPDEAPIREYQGPPGGPGRAASSTPPPFAA
jgi:hypothetical protein